MAATVSTRITRLQAISVRTVATNLQVDLTIGDFRLGADYMRDAANSFGMASTVTGGDDVRFWAGATFANRATAPFRLTKAGILTAASIALAATTAAWGSISSIPANIATAGGSPSISLLNNAISLSSAGVLSGAGGGTVDLGSLSGSVTTGQLSANIVAAVQAAFVNLAAIKADLGSVTAGNIVVGTTNKIWLNDSADGILAIGGATKASAPFQVSAAGVLTAASVTTAATTSTWAGVSGVGKPADNATVGAIWGTNLSSVPANISTAGGSPSISLLNNAISLSSAGVLSGAGGGTIDLGSLSGSVTTGQLTANIVASVQGAFANLAAIKADLGSVTAGQIVVGTTDKLWLNDGADGVFAIGGATKATAPFHVSDAGALAASSGTVGGFTLSTTQLYAGSGSTRVQFDTGAGLWLGATAQASAPFSVSLAGALTATSGNIGGATNGWSIGAGLLTALGTGMIQTSASAATGVKVDSTGIYGYHATLGTVFSLPTSGAAPIFASGIINSTVFNITSSGILETSSTAGDGSHAGVRINNLGIKGWDSASATPNFFLSTADGSITALKGSIGGWTINSAYLAKDTGTDATSAGMSPTDIPFYAGATYANRSTAPFRVSNAGYAVAQHFYAYTTDINHALTANTTGSGAALRADASGGTGLALSALGNASVSAIWASGGAGQYALELAGTGTAHIPGLLTGASATFSGDVTFGSGQRNILGTGTPNSLYVVGGNSESTSASLQLFGGTHASYPGQAFLETTAGAATSYLEMHPDGVFKWFDNSVLRFGIDAAGAVTVSGPFGINGQAAQGAYASGGAVTPGAGAFGFDSAVHAAAVATLLTNIRAALVANGIMS